jgi:DNA-binding transcriptional LysR family regulator
MLSLSQVETFLTVVDCGSFQLAATRLNCTQPSISQQLRRLEEQLGVQLITRNRARSTLTRDGEAFLPHARSLVQSAGRAEERLRSRRLVIAACGNIGVYLAPRLISEFITSRENAPELRLEIGTNRKAIDTALSGEADIALTEWSEPQQGFEWSAWHREKLVVITSPKNPLARRRRIRKLDILDHTLIGGEPGTGTGRILRELFGEAFGQIKIGLEVGSTAAVKEAVKANLGISIVLAGTVHEDRAFGSLHVLEFEEADVYKSYHALLPREPPASAHARAFLAHIRSQA